jgi:hypothetical protein
MIHALKTMGVADTEKDARYHGRIATIIYIRKCRIHLEVHSNVFLAVMSSFTCWFGVQARYVVVESNLKFQRDNMSVVRVRSTEQSKVLLSFSENYLF